MQCRTLVGAFAVADLAVAGTQCRPFGPTADPPECK
jgi:hypothetical protein